MSSAAPSILVVDDDAELRALISDFLRTSGMEVESAANGAEMDARLAAGRPDLVVLDLMMPGEDGLSILRRLRKPGGPAVIMLSAMGEDTDRIIGLEVGADDYLIKPLRRGELVTRVGVLLRQAYPAEANDVRIEFDDFAFDLRAERLKLRGKSIALTQKEFKLALLLFRHLGRPLSRAFIIETVWSRDIHVSSRTVDTHISRIRGRLDLRTERGYRLAPVYGYGYRLEKTRH